MTYAEIKLKCAALEAEVAKQEAVCVAANSAANKAKAELAAIQARVTAAFVEAPDAAGFEAAVVAKQTEASKPLVEGRAK